MFIYTQRPVIDANMLRKNGFYEFPILVAQVDLLSKNLTGRSEWLAESWNEVEATDFCVILSF